MEPGTNRDLRFYFSRKNFLKSICQMKTEKASLMGNWNFFVKVRTDRSGSILLGWSDLEFWFLQDSILDSSMNKEKVSQKSNFVCQKDFEIFSFGFLTWSFASQLKKGFFPSVNKEKNWENFFKYKRSMQSPHETFFLSTFHPIWVKKEFSVYVQISRFINHFSKENFQNFCNCPWSSSLSVLHWKDSFLRANREIVSFTMNLIY